MTIKLNCDVLVVGGGTTGCVAAWNAARYGARTIIVEKSAEPYKPACAEGISKIFADILPFKIPQDFIIHRTKSVYLWTEDVEVERKGMLWKSYMIDRKGFQKWLWNKAEKVGVEMHLTSEVTDLNEKENGVNSVTINQKGKKIEIKPNVIIAADGAHSIIREKLNINSNKDIFGYVISHEYQGMKLKRPNSENLFLGNFAPYAYGYIFPKTETAGNVGAGTISTCKKYDKKKHEELYSIFCEMVSNQIGNAKRIEERNGDIVIKFKNDVWRHKNVLFAGDSANQAIKPYVEGIAPGMIFGALSGRIAASHAKIKSETELDKYDNLKKMFSFVLEESKNIDNYLELLYQKPNHSDFPVKMLGIFANILDVEQSKHMGRNEILQNMEEWNNNKLRQYLGNVKEYMEIYYMKYKLRNLFK